jgi:hypothetical protein
MMDESARFSQRMSVIPLVVLDTTTATVQFELTVRFREIKSSLVASFTVLRGGAAELSRDSFLV